MPLLEIDSAIPDLERYIKAFGANVNEAARIALNDEVSGDGLKMIRSDVADEVAFPAGYLNDTRLGVTSRATNANLTITITGRGRPTSLGRFVRGAVAGEGVAANVRVSAQGGGSTIKRAFFVKLRAGTASTADGFNIGLAIRLKPGETLRNTHGAVELSAGLYLLYGPSVDQVFREVGPKDAPAIMAKVETEFLRQFHRLVKL